MKNLLLFICCIALGVSVNAQEKKPNPNYDAELAKKYEGEDNGMKMYVMVILKTGTNITATKLETDSAFAGHMANMGKLVKANQLIVAGPFEKNEKNFRGIFILNTKSIDEAKAILATDPAVKAKLLDADFFKWYGSAALPAYLESAGKVKKFKN